MLLALRPDKFVDSLCKKPPGSMDELHERAKGYIQMEEMFRFWNEVRHAGQKCNECKAHTKPDAHKSDKRHKPDKRQPLSKGSRKTLNELGAIVSTPYLTMKFPTLKREIVTVKVDKKQAR
ncbi:hypothetical protein JHK86_010022 [Glycine max]|nr:hypothetical protein JHK86_010022 [Glycine max]